MEETNEQPTLMSHVIKWGLIIGGASITMTVLLYAIDYTLLVLLKVFFTMLLVYLVLTIFGGIEYRKSVGGYLKYGQAFIHGFGVLALSGLIATIFGIILYNVIDPELPENLTKASLENMREMMIGFGAPENAIDEAIAKEEVKAADRYTISGQALGYLIILIASAFMALISALFVRKNEPVEL
ncbi:MAG: DUF4199 domain-containing protein [Cyclobacteriaceae bacterium]|nr:DUF4199 domain-containing protein [Cyclobacteriaceae bacterium]